MAVHKKQKMLIKHLFDLISNTLVQYGHLLLLDIALLESVQNRAARWIKASEIRLLSNGLNPLQTVSKI